jgi:FkbM family methyltransferase
MTTFHQKVSHLAASRPLLRARMARALRNLSRFAGWHTLVNRFVPQHSARFTIRNGETVFAGDMGSFIDRQVYLFGGYETESIRSFLGRTLPMRHGTMLDIGANVGTHSLAFARVFKTVHAFEPNQALWSQFERNMALNGLKNVQLHKIGLADRDAELMLHSIDKPNYGLGTFSTVEQYDLRLKPIATCPVRHAGNYLASIGVQSVDAVKIDVQGFEPEVLRGLTVVLNRDRPLIWCEIGAGTRTQIVSSGDLADLLSYKFSCFKFEPGNAWARHSVRLQERSGDLPAGDYLVIPD